MKAYEKRNLKKVSKCVGDLPMAAQVDLMLLLIEPTMYLLIAIAEENDIEPVVYNGQDEELAENETVQSQLKKSKQEIRKDST